MGAEQRQVSSARKVPRESSSGRGASFLGVILMGEAIEGGSCLGIVPNVGPEEVAHAQELSDFLSQFWGRGLSQGFMVVFARGDAFWGKPESKE